MKEQVKGFLQWFCRFGNRCAHIMPVCLLTHLKWDRSDAVKTSAITELDTYLIQYQGITMIGLHFNKSCHFLFIKDIGLWKHNLLDCKPAVRGTSCPPTSFYPLPTVPLSLHQSLICKSFQLFKGVLNTTNLYPVPAELMYYPHLSYTALAFKNSKIIYWYN